MPPVSFDSIDFRNDLAALNLSAQTCQSFETDAYGAMLGLIYFRWLKPHARRIWDLACIKAMQQSTPGQWTFRHSFFWQLRLLRQQTFGPSAVDDASINNPNIVNFPWCLSDQEFTYCYQQIVGGSIPVLPDLTKGFVDRHVTKGEVSAVAAGYGVYVFYIKAFLKKAVPEIMDFIADEAAKRAVEVVFVTFAFKLGQQAWQRSLVGNLRQRYVIDAKRRQYLRLKGKSTFSGLITAPGSR